MTIGKMTDLITAYDHTQKSGLFDTAEEISNIIYHCSRFQTKDEVEAILHDTSLTPHIRAAMLISLHEIPVIPWIPVTEALPDLLTDVLVCYDHPDEDERFIDILYYLGDNLTNLGWNHDQNVVAWAPLPKAYTVPA